MMKNLLLFMSTSSITYLVILILFFKSNNWFSIGDHIYYQTKNNEFSYLLIKGKGGGIQEMERQFSLFKNQNPQFKDLILYRKTRINYLDI
jgi:hypothetical protein